MHLVELQEEDKEGLDGSYEEIKKLNRVVLEANEGNPLLCILERFLLAEHCLNQRNSIFRTWCTVKQHVCDVIIDNGSCENLFLRLWLKLSTSPL